MSANHLRGAAAFACGLPAEMLDPTWFVRQKNDTLYALAQDQITMADVENSALSEIGHALGSLQQGHEESADGVGVLLGQYSAVHEMRLHLLHYAVHELRRRGQEMAPRA